MTLKDAIEILLRTAQEVESDSVIAAGVDLDDLEKAIETVQNTRFTDSGVF